MRLVSWNIHGGVGHDGHRDLARIASVLQDSGCDAAALQEVGNPYGPWPGAAEPAAELARLLGWSVAFGPNLVIAGRPYGNAILSRARIENAQNYDLSVPGREPRGCLRADLRLPDGRPLHLFNLHLGLSGVERRRQAGMLLSADILRDTALTAPLVVCGDFNSWSPLPGTLRQLLRSALRDAAVDVRATAATFPARFPLLRLDRAYVDAGVRVLASGVLRGPLTRAASDHLPLWVDLEPIETPKRRSADAPLSRAELAR